MRSSGYSLSEEEESQEALLAPLLDYNDNTTAEGDWQQQDQQAATGSSETEATTMVNGGQIHHRSTSSHSSMNSSNSNNNNLSNNNNNATSSAAAAALSHCRRRITEPTSGFCGGMASSSSSSNSFWQNLLHRAVLMPCAADVLPETPWSLLLTNGKYTALVCVAVNLSLILLWFPVWCLSLILTELGIYVLTVGTVFLVGRNIIRFIAFPGASRKMTLDMEVEFARYAVRMLVSAVDAWREVASCLLVSTGNTSTTSSSTNKIKNYSMPTAKQMLSPLWKRAEIHRNRVLAVFAEVLHVLYQDGSMMTTTTAGAGGHASSSCLTKYGNNRLHGDIGSLVVGRSASHISWEARQSGRELMQRLQRLLQLCDQVEEAIKVHISNNSAPLTTTALSSANEFIAVCNNLMEFCNSELHPPLLAQSSSSSGSDDSEDDDDNDRDLEDGGGGGVAPLVQTATSAGENNNNNNNNSNTTGGGNQATSSSVWGAAKSGLSSILPMLDPLPHPSVFGMDMLRGCVLSRYCGARQFWVQRPQGGQIDVLHFPAEGRASGSPSTKAVLYCNPNAGLIEVSTGLSMVGGNVPAAKNDSTAPRDNWVDFYTDLGFDVYLFNYAGYGRSYGGKVYCSQSGGRNRNDATGNHEQQHRVDLYSRFSRILHSCFWAFQPRPDTLRSDGIAVAEHILNLQQQRISGGAGVQQLVIHGESIGGMTAAGVARHFTSKSIQPSSSSSPPPLVVLVCDRTFCNLEAVAQRLVGDWTAHAIRALTFAVWNTDVAGDFLAASCPKIVAQDAVDQIIADEASLKTGVAVWKETLHSPSMKRTSALLPTTNGIGWIRDVPLRYRMAEFEDSSLSETRYCSRQGNGVVVVTAPVWPTDKHVTLYEAFHFAACCKRIGKLATALKRKAVPLSSEGEENVGLINSPDSEYRNTNNQVIEAWRSLATCDGLVGVPLGMTVKRGLDSTVAWLCCTLVYGGQILLLAAQRRTASAASVPPTPTLTALSIERSDFDQRSGGRTMRMVSSEGDLESRLQQQPQQPQQYQPMPIPEVADRIERIIRENAGAANVHQVLHELKFVASMLRYIQARLSSVPSREMALLKDQEMLGNATAARTSGNSSSDIGSFIRLCCGHNAPFSSDEKKQLQVLIEQAFAVNAATVAAISAESRSTMQVV
ncbi:hypothetical protein ACA910_019066 [Epithemia clementina (nom. ined.)]